MNSLREFHASAQDDKLPKIDALLSQVPKAKCRKPSSNRHRADFFFHFGRFHHRNRVPGAAVQEAAVWALAQTFLAADAEDGIDRDAAEGRIVLVGHPEHAVFHRTILDAGGRARAPRAAFGDDGQFFRLFLAWSGQAFGFRLMLELVGDHSRGFAGCGRGRHGVDYTSKCSENNPVLNRESGAWHPFSYALSNEATDDTTSSFPPSSSFKRTCLSH